MILYSLNFLTARSKGKDSKRWSWIIKMCGVNQHTIFSFSVIWLYLLQTHHATDGTYPRMAAVLSPAQSLALNQSQILVHRSQRQPFSQWFKCLKENSHLLSLLQMMKLQVRKDTVLCNNNSASTCCFDWYTTRSTSFNININRDRQHPAHPWFLRH